MTIQPYLDQHGVPYPHDLVDEDYEKNRDLIKNTPYGVWLLEDGTEMLFNRKYKAIAQRDSEGSRRVAMDGTKHISDILKVKYHERYFRSERHFNPLVNQGNMDRCTMILGKFFLGDDIGEFVMGPNVYP